MKKVEIFNSYQCDLDINPRFGDGAIPHDDRARRTSRHRTDLADLLNDDFEQKQVSLRGTMARKDSIFVSLNPAVCFDCQYQTNEQGSENRELIFHFEKTVH